MKVYPPIKATKPSGAVECDNIPKGNYLVEIVNVDTFDCESNSGIPCWGIDIKLIVRADSKWGYPYKSEYKGFEIEDSFIYNHDLEENMEVDHDDYEAFISVRDAGHKKMNNYFRLAKKDSYNGLKDLIGGKFIAAIKNGMIDIDNCKPFRFA